LTTCVSCISSLSLLDALPILGLDRVVFCGVPMTITPHYFGGVLWDIADHYFKRWYMIAPEFQARMKSMSGRTRELLGAPDKEWVDRKSTRLNSSHVKISYAVF